MRPPIHPQECQLFTAGYYYGGTEYYCSDTCDAGTCEEGEICELLYTPCAGPDVPCPPVAVCTGDCNCGPYQASFREQNQHAFEWKRDG